MDRRQAAAAYPSRVQLDEVDHIPAVELSGSRADRLKVIEAALARLLALRSELADEPVASVPQALHGRYINAPVWPWFTAGWILGAAFVLLFVLAWSYS